MFSSHALLLGVCASLLSAVNSVIQSDEVLHFPGLDNVPLPSKMYSGYLKASVGNQECEPLS